MPLASKQPGHKIECVGQKKGEKEMGTIKGTDNWRKEWGHASNLLVRLLLVPLGSMEFVVGDRAQW